MGGLKPEQLGSVVQACYAYVIDPQQKNPKNLCAERIKFCRITSLVEYNWKVMPGFSWMLTYVPFSLDHFNLYHFFVINTHHEYDGFTEFCESFYQIIVPEGTLGTPDTIMDSLKNLQ